MLDGKPLFTIKARILSFSPEDRAKLISGRLEALVKDPLFRADML